MKRFLQCLWIVSYVITSALPYLGISLGVGAVSVLLLKIPHLAFNLPRYDWIVPLSVFAMLVTFLFVSWSERRCGWINRVATRISDRLIPGGRPPQGCKNA